MLYYASIRSVYVREINHRIALKIGHIFYLCLKTDTSIIKFTKSIVKKLVQLAGIYYFISY